MGKNILRFLSDSLPIRLTLQLMKNQVVKFWFQKSFHDGGNHSELPFIFVFRQPVQGFFFESYFYIHKNDAF